MMGTLAVWTAGGAAGRDSHGCRTKKSAVDGAHTADQCATCGASAGSSKYIVEAGMKAERRYVVEKAMEIAGAVLRGGRR